MVDYTYIYKSRLANGNLLQTCVYIYCASVINDLARRHVSRFLRRVHGHLARAH